MKTIGIVGGIAWPSSIVYYRIINERVAQRLGDGGLHSARLVLAQTDFEQIERNQREGRWDLVGELLAEEGDFCQGGGRGRHVHLTEGIDPGCDFCKLEGVLIIRKKAFVFVI